MRLSVPFAINPKGWEKALQRCRAKTYHGQRKTPASLINRELDLLEDKINGIFAVFEETEEVPSVEAIKGKIDGNTDEMPKAEETLLNIFNKYVKEGTANGRWAKSTILDKYKTIDLPSDKALPVISNQRMNDYLKEIGRICQIDEPITITTYKGNTRIEKTYKKYELLSTHCGRRTFVCNALMLGIPANIVMQWTGNSNYEAMRPYIAIADNARKTAMERFNR